MLKHEQCFHVAAKTFRINVCWKCGSFKIQKSFWLRATFRYIKQIRQEQNVLNAKHNILEPRKHILETFRHKKSSDNSSLIILEWPENSNAKTILRTSDLRVLLRAPATRKRWDCLQSMWCVSTSSETSSCRIAACQNFTAWRKIEPLLNDGALSFNFETHSGD